LNGSKLVQHFEIQAHLGRPNTATVSSARSLNTSVRRGRVDLRRRHAWVGLLPQE